jgi:recombinational DNA repair ATPase RecF
MHIEYLRLKNFRAFKDVELRDVPRFAVLVGANGTGKSTLFSVFGFLRDAMTTNVSTALARLGGARFSNLPMARARICTRASVGLGIGSTGRLAHLHP